MTRRNARRRFKVVPRVRAIMSLNPEVTTAPSHRFRFIPGRLIRKRPNHHSRKLLEKLEKLVSQVEPDDSPYAGLLISPTLQNNSDETFDVKLKIFAEDLHKPVSFTCPAATRVGYLVDSLKPFLGDSKGSFVFKVTGLDEYLSNETVLSDYEYICACRRLGKTAWLTLISLDAVQRPWTLVTCEECDLDVGGGGGESSSGNYIGYEDVRERVINFENAADRLIADAQKSPTSAAGNGGDLLASAEEVRRAVVDLCVLVGETETGDVHRSTVNLINFLREIVFDNRDAVDATRKAFLVGRFVEDIEMALARFLDMHSERRLVEFAVDFLDDRVYRRTYDYAVDSNELFGPRIEMATQLQKWWLHEYDTFTVDCALTYGERLLSHQATRKVCVTQKFFQCVNFDERVVFKTATIRSLPRETKLYMTLIGHREGVDQVLGWTALNVFADRDHFNGGEFLLGLWSSETVSPRGPACASERDKGYLHVSLPYVRNPAALSKSISREPQEAIKKPFHSLSADIQRTLLDLTVNDVSQPLPQSVRDMVWHYRHYLCDFPSLLPHLLRHPACWNAANIDETYMLVRAWCPLSPEEALTLLSPTFPDSLVRKYAVRSLQSVGSDELSLYLAQLVESLRFQTWDDSFLAVFLLQRARQSVRLAHQLFWWLTGMINEPLMRHRALVMRKALFFIAGEKVSASLLTQVIIDDMLAETARNIKDASDSQKQEVMRRDLSKLNESLKTLKLRLPLDPAISVESIDIDTCCIFPSKTLPFKLVFRSSEEAAEKIEVIYKAGDDLRQDMLMLSVIRLMDKLWLESGMDMKMLTFKCIATGENHGFVEAVRDVSTLRAIQTAHSGVTGAFNNRTITDWFWKHNPSRAQYQAAVDNFIKSCAGCCVATYVLGVGDRHNDNILLSTSGHMLHIDFSKVLGRAETLGGIKRDRAPVALTPDMVYVIRRNAGEAHFVRLCCEAYNVIRRNSNLLLALFSIMKYSGMVDVDRDALAYLHRSMSLDATDEQAARHFEKRIRESVMTLATSFNFFIHNLAVLGAATRGECALKLSFNPRDFSVAAEGRIVRLRVEGIRLRYHPERYYVYVVAVTREFPPTQSVVRTYKQFLELYSKMSKKFPDYDFCPLSRGTVFSSESDESLAQRRKRYIQEFLDSVMALPDEVAHYRLMYSFFHPLPRDLELRDKVPITIAT
ncbi:LOW QUALITY PROTEIN: phosphatidylinositol 4-phosphate 3-kinase C2 domain-containing subunit alpha-like [Dermacentor silvarum]|uniref:LOW QUALITY PROTEIN: phosphatidylinositol 4-phosphate 3-kinase C2 domain-containing subunit alpha-like n=1 Tax=Dermacentor silvarum TaxID=543639 RepID=UPI00189BF3F4|nr:LOW QUALITY PROTEIN: phosphatidylinositol 4-phosphate 3-kinase C2 domain-containing subunit alpha-like [Dermacentor silvarum]